MVTINNKSDVGATCPCGMNFTGRAGAEDGILMLMNRHKHYDPLGQNPPLNPPIDDEVLAEILDQVRCGDITIADAINAIHLKGGW